MKSRVNGDLRGRKRLSGLLLWGMVPLMVAGLIRVTFHLGERFGRSTQLGFQALIQLGIIVLGLLLLAVVLGWCLERWLRRRAIAASGTTRLIPVSLGMNSYQQACDIVGSPVFFPARHEGAYLVVREDSLEIYTGFREYHGPLMRIEFAVVEAISKEVVSLPVGKEPGMVVQSLKGPFELGFTRAAAYRGRSTSRDVADHAFQTVVDAFSSWKADQK